MLHDVSRKGKEVPVQHLQDGGGAAQKGSKCPDIARIVLRNLSHSGAACRTKGEFLRLCLEE